MPQRILPALTWKAATVAAALALGISAAGASTIVPALIADNETAPTEQTTPVVEDVVDDVVVDVADDSEVSAVEVVVDDSTIDADATEETEATADDDLAESGEVAETHGHPDNFGAIVSADARDGGVDGQEISDMAHARNEALHGDSEAEATEADDETEADDAAETADEADEADEADAAETADATTDDPHTTEAHGHKG